jgi:hypothetical protein
MALQMTQADRVLSTPPANTSALPVDPTRRCLLTIAAGGAVAAALPTAGLTAAIAADPIFTAIDEHRKADAAHLAAIKEVDRLYRIHGDADESITEKPCDAENEAFEALVAATASTLPGLVAKLAYLRDIGEREAWMLDQREGVAFGLIESFAESISSIWGVQS